MKFLKSQSAFTLAELLIALAILGVIATFTIPKILDSGNTNKKNAIAKEVASMISGAYQAYKLENTATGATNRSDLSAYMNFVRVKTSGAIDEYNGNASQIPCVSHTCLVLHNGAVLSHPFVGSFGDTQTTNAFAFWVDVDGDVQHNGSATGEGKSVVFWLYFNGRLTTWDNLQPNTYSSSGGPFNPSASNDPNWFSWSN